MNNYKYFKVKEIKLRNGETIYKVFATQNKILALLGLWDEYSYRNQSLADAIEHIQEIFMSGKKSEKTVYKKHF